MKDIQQVETIVSGTYKKASSETHTHLLPFHHSGSPSYLFNCTPT